MRGNTSTDFAVDPQTITINGPIIKAKVNNSKNANGTFDLAITAYDGILRLYINEPHSKTQRFEVPDVLLPDIESMHQNWQTIKKTATKLKLRLDSSNTDVDLLFNPVQLIVSSNDQPFLTWNYNKHFMFEHRREKQEGDPDGWWEETFKSHHDSKPRGPEAISFDIQFHDFNHLYGIPERATSFSLSPTRMSNGTALSEPYRLYNLDVFEYLSESPFGLYGSIPVLYAHRPGRTVGAFWLNAAEMYVDIIKTDSSATSAQWFAESGIVDLFVMLGPSPVDASRQYARLTGGSALPQMFALGYHQCRWNYKDEEDVKLVDSGFDAHTIPYDVLWLDIEHTDGKRYFTWDKNYFPHPVEMQDDIASRGRKMVTIVDPHIKRDSDWRIFSEAQSKGLFVKNKDGNDFEGWCWPGSSSYLDYVSPAVRTWWADQFALDKYIGSTSNLYVWNDMNEPSVFNGPEISMHKDAKHAVDAEHRDVHNAYGYFYHMATADGLRRRGFSTAGPDGNRPFVLSRAFFSGSQRIGAIWTGDNSAEWEHLEASVPMLLSINVVGLSFSGADVGGFFGNPDAQLMTRWYQLGAYYPFFRGHAHLETKRREPWLFGEETTGYIREAIRQRYRLLPYMYTLFFKANISGLPVMRPLWYEFPGDKNDDILAEDKLFMLGSSLLVAPVLKKDTFQVGVTLPGGDLWYDGLDGTALDSSTAQHASFNATANIYQIRTYLRGGTMLPLKERPRRSSLAMAEDPITLIVSLDRAGEAVGELYLDDGRSYAFQEGEYSFRNFLFSKDGMLISKAGDVPVHAGLIKANGKYKSNVLIDKVVILGMPGGAQGWNAMLVSGGRGQSGRTMEVMPGPLYLQPGLQEVAVIVRKAGLPADGDWSIRFEKQKGSAGGSLSR